MTVLKAGKYKKSLFILILLFVEAVIIFIINYYVVVIAGKNVDIVVHNEKNNKSILEDMKYFPIPLKYQSEITFEDSFGAYRDNGGHEGCDIMDVKNEAGRIPVISATDGRVTNIGWLYLGGYRIGITSDNNIYYYYAHLDTYVRGIELGDDIKAGQLIGFMGNTGEGTEGTRGKFPVHLHFGIYVKDVGGKEQAVNSYPYLMMSFY